MQTKVLNLYDAFHLASIISQYVDTNNLNPDVVDFIQGIVEQISAQEYLTCVSMMTDKTEAELVGEFSLDILTAFIDGLKENQIISLVSFYKSFGL